MKSKTLLPAIALLYLTANAQDKRDITAIKNMAGCYEVSFNFSETFSPNKEYKKKDNYHSKALEWVAVVEEQPNKIALQHLLVVNPKGEGKNAIVKHWRQDWLYKNTDLYVFNKENHWKYKSLNPKQVKGQWTQIVYQVDDAPRYSGSGTWIHLDEKTFWESTADAPLPRREYTTRTDYNVLNRTNRHEITEWGWLHFQDNKKILRQDNQEDTIVAEEIGKEYYKKIDDKKCLIAQNYWKEYAPLWAAVREEWANKMNKKQDLYVKPKVQDTYLYSELMKLEPQQTTEAKELVKKYIVK
ncbi:hypothetical protein J5295_00735 [Riemerella anatipestifer]|uniref:DUF6607 family protein n=1 Tax=Riemerella anatipestifer TaxID=34085 RepID=UPI0001F0DECF|nr:DUF6607 family protein [Riemerella anatipestifer]AKQ39280.1 hypothetical protein AS87_02815 [Riemerella anatipestifer Yb2]EFT35396.1 hypothetical protein RAYM_06185 [Riemerella anatipestifer RA-YM]MBT0525322.1 hypothetical protein [Riemerella anatipestifer]MBT0527164.1 hypothetical protein [Riemerella anatipestifer]MBT0529205.1 hypothetical protein [Riemerella anatipestifer]